MQPMSDQAQINELFNANSQAFRNATEQQFQSGSYKRGQVFLNAVLSLVKAPANILDYGCGTGRISIMLGKEGYKVTGVDPAVQHIDIARSLNDLPNVSFQVVSESLPDEIHNLDAVVSSSVFEFVPDPEKYITEIYKTLKPGGKLFISFPNTNSLWRLYSKIRFGGKYQHFKFQKNLFNRKQITTLLERNGFRLLKGPTYYESAFDRKGLSFLNNSVLFGTLMMMVFAKKENP